MERDAHHTVGVCNHNNTRTLRDSLYLLYCHGSFIYVLLSNSSFFFVFWLVSSLNVPFIVIIILHVVYLLNSTIFFIGCSRSFCLTITESLETLFKVQFSSWQALCIQSSSSVFLKGKIFPPARSGCCCL